MHSKFLSIYLAGNIQKGHERESQLFWTEAHQREMEHALAPLSLSFLNPAVRSDDLSDQLSVFGRDMTQVFCSDLIIVDARERRGLGVGAEMMWAKWHTIPVIALAPPNSHYRKDKGTLLGEEVEGWVHPFVECLSDVIVEDFLRLSSGSSDSYKAVLHRSKDPLSLKRRWIIIGKPSSTGIRRCRRSSKKT